MPTLVGSVLWLLSASYALAAVMPPPWADPASNPCAAQPRGWQLLYWPADGKCYKIFQIGAPCPETMELGPAAGGGGTIAECRCPPGTAQSPRDARCHPIFTRASCPDGQYFAPVPAAPGKPRWGVCREQEPCPVPGHAYWPRDGKCYRLSSKGPCPKGELLAVGKDGLAICTCSRTGNLARYFWPGNRPGCYEHYTKGPCAEPGEIFLPGGTCGCRDDLPHYHEPTGMCYQLGGVGPCSPGHYFVATTDDSVVQPDETNGLARARCVCKPGHALYRDGSCYRLYTRGPCPAGSMLSNATTCAPVPCKRGRLWFAAERTCYRIGTRGPCPNGRVVVYDRDSRPSIDGVSYNGACGCTDATKMAGGCDEEDEERPERCEDAPGQVLVDGVCHKLYTQGPCRDGEWLVARRTPRTPRALWQGRNLARAKCQCRPGYRRIRDDLPVADTESNSLVVEAGCQPPAVALAKFLNDNVASIRV